MEGLRQRTTNNGMLSSLKDYDAYAKPLEDFRVKTATGASITLASIFIIFVLITSEFHDWLKVDMVPSLEVDKSRKELMQINLNITFPKIPCFLLSIDVMDVAGEHQNGGIFTSLNHSRPSNA
jgi:endoplasmic reticulum-Golgi intermediate compartment protein 3